MRILRLHEGTLIDRRTTSDWCGIDWPDLKLSWLQMPPKVHLFDSSPQQGGVILWEKEGCHRIDDIWAELSIALLDHDIMCEPLGVTLTLALPAQEQPPWTDLPHDDYR